MVTRRRFLRSSASLLAASWAVSPSEIIPGAVPGSPFSCSPPPPVGPDVQDRIPGSRKWTPLDQALNRFYAPAHRFPSERWLRLLSPSIAQLRASLLADGRDIEECLSPRFRGSSVISGRERVLRQDECFHVRQMEWDVAYNETRSLNAAEFSADLRRSLASHVPLTLAELDCVHATETSAPTPKNERKNLITLVRFELASKTGTEGGDIELAPTLTEGCWQATGEWALEWEPVGKGSESDPIEWKVVAWRPREMTVVRAPAVIFTDVTAAAFGQDPSYATHLLRDTNYWRAVLDVASGIDIFGNCGVSVGDADGDGQDEIYLCQPQGLPNRLYRQRSPGVFEDAAASAGVDLLDATSMALFADVRNRGRQDLILITESQPLLFVNDGHGRFTLVRDAFPPSPQQASLTGAALADYDCDGFLDLYVCSYGYFQGQGAAPIPTPYYDAHNGPPNHLYRNRGDGTFVDVTTASGLDRGNDRFSFACTWADIDDDGWPDLCVVNDFGRNNLYHNHRDGTFEEIIEGLPGYGAGMSAAFADLDGDGLGELYVANMWSAAGQRVTADPEFQKRFAEVGPGPVRQFAMGNTLYHTTSATAAKGQVTAPEQRGGAARRAIPKMEEVPDTAGARRGLWAWCSDVLDLENDGWQDIYVLNGFLSWPSPSLTPVDAYLWEEVIALSPHTNTPSAEYRAAWAASFELAHRGRPWDGFQRNVFFLNLGRGRFVDASAATGLNFPDDGRSFAVFDYDGDGDADLVVHSRTGPQLRLLRNDLANSNKSLAIRLTGRKGNRDAIGARVEVETLAGRQVRFLNCGSGFLAQHSKEMVFGLGPQSEATIVRVRWPRGAVTEYRRLEAGYRYYLVEDQQNPRRQPLATADSPGARSPRSQTGDPPLPEPVPRRFSTVLVDPLPMPSLGAMRLFDALAADETSAEPQPTKTSGSHRYALLWLWDPAQAEGGKSRESQHAAGLEAVLEVQGQLPSRLVLWGDGSVPSRAAKRLEYPAWRANQRFRLFCSTMLAYLFDYRRDPPLPTGLLFEVGAGANHNPAELASFRKLVKVYWGGAGAGEILRDARSGVKSGAAALPFPGRSVLCSFRRDLRSIGAALPAVGFPGAAEIYLAQVVEDSPGDAEAQYNLALSRRETGKTELALLGVRAALAAKPVFPEAENLLAVVLIDSGRLAEARSQLERATREAPDFAEAWSNLGYVLLSDGDLEAARKALEKSLALAPDFPDALNNLGILFARQGALERARELFQKALTTQPDNEQAANNLGVLYARQGNTQQAIETLQNLLMHNPEAVSALLNLARLESSLGKKQQAKDLLNSWIARHPQDNAARQLLDRLSVNP